MLRRTADTEYAFRNTKHQACSPHTLRRKTVRLPVRCIATEAARRIFIIIAFRDSEAGALAKSRSLDCVRDTSSICQPGFAHALPIRRSQNRAVAGIFNCSQSGAMVQMMWHHFLVTVAWTWCFMRQRCMPQCH